MARLFSRAFAVSLVLGSVTLGAFNSASFAATTAKPYVAPRQTQMKPFIDGLLRKMTIEEKAGQLAQFGAGWAATGPELGVDLKKDILAGKVGALLNVYTPAGTRQFQEVAVTQTRLKIPLLFGFDVIHGHRTIFPVPLAESASWDMAAMEKSARIAASEAAADGLHWTFAPMVDVSRDPRWGRITEGAGEDPYLASRIAHARVRGFKGKGVGNVDTVLSCVKHFAAYGAPIAGRDYHSVDMSMRELLEVYMPPYRAAVKAGADTVMTSFNDIAGVPSTSNKWLLQNVLRDTWGFKGFVVSDWTSVMELKHHGVVADSKGAAFAAFDAGTDMDMSSAIYSAELPKLVREGKITTRALDRSVRRILEAKWKLGLFQDPYRYSDEERAKKTLLAPAHLEHAREMARKSIVLLQNKNATLPLPKGARVAVIGPFGDDRENSLGSWSGAGDKTKVSTLMEGLRKAMSPEATIAYAKGASILFGKDLMEHLKKNGRAFDDDPRSREELLNEALTVAEGADVIVAALGESRELSGEAASRSMIRVPENQQTLLKALKATGKPVILTLFTGRPLAIEEEIKHADAVLVTWFLGSRAGEAIADVLVGDYNPSAKLPITLPRNEGQIPIFYAQRNTGRPIDPSNPEDWWKSRYLDVPNEPLYPFGWGLSYTTFKYAAPTIDKTVLRAGGKVTVSVAVTNTGAYVGEETVQLYIRDLVASIAQPVKLLKNFAKVTLKPGETKTVSFALREADLRFLGPNNKFISEDGAFKAMVGGNSAELQAVAFELKK